MEGTGPDVTFEQQADQRAAEYRLSFVNKHHRDYSDYEKLDRDREQILHSADWAYRSQRWGMLLAFTEKLYSYLEQCGEWERLAKYLETLSTFYASRWLALETELASLYSGRGELDRAEELYRRLIRNARELHMKSQLLAALFALARDHVDCGRMKKAKRYLDECLSLCDEVSEEEMRARVYSQLGNIALSEGDWKYADSMYKKALEVWRELGESEGHAHETLYSMGRLRLLEGRYEEAQKLLIRSLEIKERINDRHGIAQVYHQLSSVNVALGEQETAEAYVAESFEMCKALGDQRSMAHCLIAYGGLSLAQGNPQMAQEHWKSAFTTASSFPTLQLQVVIHLLPSYVVTGNFGELLTWLLHVPRVILRVRMSPRKLARIGRKMIRRYVLRQ